MELDGWETTLFETVYVACTVWLGAIAWGCLVDFVEVALGHRKKTERSVACEPSQEETEYPQLIGSGKIDFELFSDTFQFFVADENLPTGHLGVRWSNDDLDNCLALSTDGRCFSVGTHGVSKVSISLQVFKKQDTADLALRCSSLSNLSEWDRVNECSVRADTGRLCIHSVLSDAALAVLQPGTYRARIYYSSGRRRREKKITPIDELQEKSSQDCRSGSSAKFATTTAAATTNSECFQIVLWPAPFEAGFRRLR